MPFDLPGRATERAVNEAREEAMTVFSLTRAVFVAIIVCIAGCRVPSESALLTTPAQASTDRSAPTAIVRAAPPDEVPAPILPAVPPPLPASKAAAALTTPSRPDTEWVAAGTLRVIGHARPKLPPPIVEQEVHSSAEHVDAPSNSTISQASDPVATEPVPPGEFLPSIPVVPDSPLPPPVKRQSVLDSAKRDSTPAPLPPLRVEPAPQVLPGPIELNGKPSSFDTLAKLADGNACSHCGSALVSGGCSSCGPCGDPPCRAGACEPFPARTAAGRVIGLIYSSVCCPDPCYQPHWEPLADAAFFVDAVRPRTSTRVRWDYGSHFAYPDRGEYFFARGDGSGRGPRANPPLVGIPYVDYHELMLITEIATGAAGVQIAVPYRSVNATPFGQDGAGFSDMSITAKTMLLDSELLLFGFQMRTYIPIGQTGKGLGTGHVSLEPGLNIGLRCTPSTYLQAQVVEWIPIGGNTDYQGAHLRWGVSLNQVLWRPIKDVQLIGTLETTGISFQDGLFTDPELGPQRLAKRTSAHLGAGLRLFFCDTFDIGLGWQHGITGKYLMRDQTRFEVRYRY